MPEDTLEKKRRWVGIVVVGLVVAGLAIGASVAVRYLGGDGIEKLGEYFRQLPLTEEGRPQVADEPGVDQDGLPESGQEGEEEERGVATPTPIKKYNLAVTIQYRRQDQFLLEITNLERTQEASDIETYTIVEDIPYSLIQILNAQDQIVVEEKFQVVTEVLVDGVGSQISPIYALDESVSRFTLSLPSEEELVKVRLVTLRGEVLDEQSLSFNDLSSTKKGGQIKGILFRRLADWWLGGGQALGAESTLNIAVISSVPRTSGMPPLPPDLSVLNAIKSRVESGMLAIDPWSVYASRVAVMAVPNTQDLGCFTVTFQGGSFPVCPNQGKIQSVLAQLLPGVQVHAVVVVAMDAPCNCGTSSYLGNKITAVGTYSTGALIAHEFGHALAVLADEYYGDLGVSGPSGPNCFGSMEQCQGTISAYDNSDGVCSQGCNNPSTVRPANLMMYGNLSAGRFGPVEKCLMGRAIAAVLGEKYEGDCGEEGPGDDSPRGPGPGPGWYREY